MGSQGKDQDEITVLVTGFGVRSLTNLQSLLLMLTLTSRQPFREQYPVNPSYEIAKGLPTYLPPLRAKDPGSRTAIDIPEVHILIHPKPIHVGYKTVRELVPKLWEGGGKSPDIVVHIGMAGPRPFYQIERKGHRQGYESGDVDGEKLEDEREGGHGEDWIWYGCPEELETDLDLPDILARWQGHSSVSIRHDRLSTSLFSLNSQSDMDLRVSDDAGRYLCDFIYYSSLSHLWKQNKPRNVIFLHVPSDASEPWLAQGRELAVNLIRSIVESDITRRGQVHDEPDGKKTVERT